MLVWIENAPTLEKNSELEIVKFVDKHLTRSSNDEESAQLQTHKHSRTCRKKGNVVCRFEFPLPPLPETMLLYPLEENVAELKKSTKSFRK